MLEAPHMLLIGATARNAGKTEFACSLLRHFRPTRPVTAAKITVIRSEGGPCPRGGEGCGVCGSLSADYEITEETNRDGAKDTSRLLNAGAQRVFWLRVREAHMREGLAALYQQVDPHTPLICESNSIRHAVKPGLFLMVKDERSDAFKATARAVSHLADRTVNSDGARFDLVPDAITMHAGGWRLREPATAVILAGGASTRMGEDKSLLAIEGRPMIQHVHDQLQERFDEILLSANDTRHAFLGLRTIPDRQPDMGPMMGLASALSAATSSHAFVVACDIPRINISLAHRMLNQADSYDAVVPRIMPPASSDTPHLEPLFAVYRRDAAPRMFELLARGERHIRSFFAASRVLYIDLEPDDAPRNLNTEEDYRAYVSRTDTGV